MSYFVLEFDFELGAAGIIVEDEPGMDLKFMQGHAFEADETPAGLRIECEENWDEYPDLLNVVRAPAGNERFVQAIASAGVDNVEWYPAELHTPTRAVSGYSVMNIIGRIACVDMAASQMTLWRGKVARMKSLALDQKRIGDAAIFRLHEYPEAIVVEKRVAAKLTGLTGFTLVPAAGWSDENRF